MRYDAIPYHPFNKICTMKKYVIKEHKVSPFDKHEPDQFFLGFLTDFDHYTLAFKTTKLPLHASIMNLREAALAVAKLNKMNMRFYELCDYDKF
jgi:hypothetical protein